MTLGRSTRASHRGGFSRCREQALGVRASGVVAHKLCCPVACMEPMSPAWAGRFLITGPPENPTPVVFMALKDDLDGQHGSDPSSHNQGKNYCLNVVSVYFFQGKKMSLVTCGVHI